MTRMTLTRLGYMVCSVCMTAGPAIVRAADTYKIDSSHSNVVFRVKHLNVAYFYGRFNETSGICVFDEKDPSNSRIEVTVKADSIDTKDEKRDRHLKSPDFFNAKQFPELKFVSTQIKPVGKNELEVTGDFTLHGVTKPITVKVERTGSGPDPWGGHRTGFETTFTIKRSDYGMDYMLKGLGDEVKLMIGIEAVRR